MRVGKLFGVGPTFLCYSFLSLLCSPYTPPARLLRPPLAAAPALPLPSPFRPSLPFFSLSPSFFFSFLFVSLFPFFFSSFAAKRFTNARGRPRADTLPLRICAIGESINVIAFRLASSRSILSNRVFRRGLVFRRYRIFNGRSDRREHPVSARIREYRDQAMRLYRCKVHTVWLAKNRHVASTRDDDDDDDEREHG